MADPIERVRDRMTYLYRQLFETSGPPKEALMEAFEEFSTVLEELQQTDEELHLRNGELLEAQQSLEQERQRYLDLFDFAPDAYLVTNENGTIEEANRAAGELLNVRQDFLIGKPLTLFLPHKEHKMLFGLMQNGIKRLTNQEMNIVPRGRTAITVAVNITALHEHNGKIATYRWLIRDISEQKRAQAALQASEERFRALFYTSHIGMSLVDTHGMVVEINHAFQEMLGYTSQELHSMDVEQLVDPEDLPAYQSVIQKLWQGQIDHHQSEVRYRRKNGQVIWARKTISLLGSNHQQAKYLVIMDEDITLEKQALLERDEMQHRILDSIEKERLHLSQELHDGPIQDLLAATFKLDDSQHKVQDSAILENLQETGQIIKSVAGTLRNVCGELRPPSLNNLGLDRAIRSHAEKLQQTHPNIDIGVQLAQDNGLLPIDVRVTLFRVYQQSMANVLRHAQANQVWVLLEIQDDQIVFEIKDDGKGFDLPEKWIDLLRQGHYGLAGIAERVQSLNGCLAVDTAPNEGTTIRVTIPRSASS